MSLLINDLYNEENEANELSKPLTMTDALTIEEDSTIEETVADQPTQEDEIVEPMRKTNNVMSNSKSGPTYGRIGTIVFESVNAKKPKFGINIRINGASNIRPICEFDAPSIEIVGIVGTPYLGIKVNYKMSYEDYGAELHEHSDVNFNFKIQGYVKKTNDTIIKGYAYFEHLENVVNDETNEVISEIVDSGNTHITDWKGFVPTYTNLDYLGNDSGYKMNIDYVPFITILLDNTRFIRLDTSVDLTSHGRIFFPESMGEITNLKILITLKYRQKRVSQTINSNKSIECEGEDGLEFTIGGYGVNKLFDAPIFDFGQVISGGNIEITEIKIISLTYSSSLKYEPKYYILNLS